METRHTKIFIPPFWPHTGFPPFQGRCLRMLSTSTAQCLVKLREGEKNSQKCLIESSDFLAVKAGTEKELLRAKTRVGQGMASVYKRIKYQEAVEKNREMQRHFGQVAALKKKPQLSVFLTCTVPCVRVLRGYCSVCHSYEEHS